MDAQYRLRFRQQARWRRVFLAMKWMAGVPLALLFAFAEYTGAKVPAALFGGLLGAVFGASLLGWRDYREA